MDGAEVERKKTNIFNARLTKENLSIPLSLLNTKHVSTIGGASRNLGAGKYVNRYKGIRFEYNLLKSIILGKNFHTKSTSYDHSTGIVKLGRNEIARLDGAGKVREVRVPDFTGLIPRFNLFRLRLRQLGVNCLSYKGGSVVMSSDGKRLKLPLLEWTTLPIEFQAPIAKEKLVEHVVLEDRKPQNILPLVPSGTPPEYSSMHSYCGDFCLNISAKMDWNSAIGKFVVKYDAFICPKPPQLVRGDWNKGKEILCRESRVVTYNIYELEGLHKLLYVEDHRTRFVEKLYGMMLSLQTKFNDALLKNGFILQPAFATALNILDANYDAKYTSFANSGFYSRGAQQGNSNGWSYVNEPERTAFNINPPLGAYGATNGTFADVRGTFTNTTATIGATTYTIAWTNATNANTTTQYGM